jgi:hypothetical protein
MKKEIINVLWDKLSFIGMKLVYAKKLNSPLKLA